VLRRPGRVVAIVAKLEKAEAIANLDAIIAEVDAVIVALGRTIFSQLHRVRRGA
jgi:pyruvate kinase